MTVAFDTGRALTLGERLLLFSFRPNGGKVARLKWAGVAAAIAGGAIVDLALHGLVAPSGGGRLVPRSATQHNGRQEVLKVIQRDSLPRADRDRPERWMRDCTLIARSVGRGLAAQGIGRTTWAGGYLPPSSATDVAGWAAVRAALLDDIPADSETALILWILTLDGLNADSVFSRDPLSNDDPHWWKRAYRVAAPTWESLETAGAVRAALSGIAQYTRWSPSRA